MFSEVFPNGVFCISKNLQLKITEIRNASNIVINKAVIHATTRWRSLTGQRSLLWWVKTICKCMLASSFCCLHFLLMLALLRAVPGRNTSNQTFITSWSLNSVLVSVHLIWNRWVCGRSLIKWNRGIIPQRQEDNFVLERSNIVRTWKIRYSGSDVVRMKFMRGEL